MGSSEIIVRHDYKDIAKMLIDDIDKVITAMDIVNLQDKLSVLYKINKYLELRLKDYEFTKNTL